MMEKVWRKSSFSGGEQACVEVAIDHDSISVRDTKDQGAGPELNFTPAEWRAFLAGVRGGEFELGTGTD